MRTTPLRSLALVCMILIAASCSSSRETNENANYASIDNAAQPGAVVGEATGSTPAPPVDSAGADPDAAPVDEFDELVTAFDSFLALRAQAITGEIAVEELNKVATPQAIEQVAELRSINDELIARDSYAVLSNLAEWSNVTSVAQASDGRYVFTDCTERQHVTPGGTTVVDFVTNNVMMIDDQDGYLVDTVIETQDGVVAVAPGEFGCVPASFAERAEQTASFAVNEAARLIADPGAADASDLPLVFDGQARADLERALQTLAFEGLSRVSDEVVELSVVGMDVNRPEFTVVVSVCRTYPQGRTYTTSDGEQTTTDLPAGSSYEEWLYVQLEAVPAGAQSNDVATVIEDRGPNCRKG